MEVKKTVLFTFFKAPKIHVNSAADKQENFSRKEETLIFYQHQKSCLRVTSTFYGDLLKRVILVEFRCPQATALTASGCLQCTAMQTSRCGE